MEGDIEMNPPNPILRRNLMLIGSAISLVLAIIFGLTPQTCIESPRTILNVGVIVVLGFIAAIGFRLWADELLRDPTWPWYARGGSGALLIASLVLMTGVGYFVIEHVLVTTATRYAPPPLACLFLFLGSELLFVPLLDWPLSVSVRVPSQRQAPPPPCTPYTGQRIRYSNTKPKAPAASRTKPVSRRYVSPQRRKSKPNPESARGPNRNGGGVNYMD
jgi:hypothetical protein